MLDPLKTAYLLLLSFLYTMVEWKQTPHRIKADMLNKTILNHLVESEEVGPGVKAHLALPTNPRSLYSFI